MPAGTREVEVGILARQGSVAARSLWPEPERLARSSGWRSPDVLPPIQDEYNCRAAGACSCRASLRSPFELRLPRVSRSQARFEARLARAEDRSEVRDLSARLHL